MIITCPACETRYYAGETSLGNRARKVKCASCGHRWSVEPEPGWSAEQSDSEPEAEAIVTDSLSERPEPEMLAPEADAAPIEEMDIYASPRPRGRMLDRIVSLVLALMILTGLVAAAVQYRVEVVRLWPGLGGLYSRIGMPVNVRALEIRNTSWKIETRSGVPLLIVTGDVINTARRLATVPQLQLIVRDAQHHELYRWSANVPQLQLGPGESTAFSTNLESPPKEAHDVEIGFNT